MAKMKQLIQSHIDEHISTIERLRSIVPDIDALVTILGTALRKGHKILLAGNGGSAADAQQIAAELVGKFEKHRRALPALALTTDTSIMTAVGNDYGFEAIFSRQIEALGQSGDVFIAISTSGNSVNILRAVEAATSQGMTTIGLLGKSGGTLRDLVDHPLIVPSDNTARIQEAHILIGHILCQIIEESLFPLEPSQCP